MTQMHRRINAAILTKHQNIIDRYDLRQNIQSAKTVVIPVKNELTSELCEKICRVTIGSTNLVKSYEPSGNSNISAGTYLYKILQPNPPNKTDGLFDVESTPGEFYNFLIALNRHIAVEFKVIEAIKCFAVKGKPFNYSSFRTYKSRAKQNGFVSLPALDSLFS
jgi:hypothetical protein